MTKRIGFGGGCHWCTEAVFESLRGVTRVAQGWLAPAHAATDLSEAVLIDFEPDLIGLSTLVAVHLHTHSCTSNHALRARYRSAVYALSSGQAEQATRAIAQLQRTDFQLPILTRVCRLGAFRGSDERYLHYGRRHAGQPFCERFIDPKLALLKARFAAHAIALPPAGDAADDPSRGAKQPCASAPRSTSAP